MPVLLAEFGKHLFFTGKIDRQAAVGPLKA